MFSVELDQPDFRVGQLPVGDDDLKFVQADQLGRPVAAFPHSSVPSGLAPTGWSWPRLFMDAPSDRSSASLKCLRGCFGSLLKNENGFVVSIVASGIAFSLTASIVSP